MSFKRDGDDLSLLSNLQKRRICDLLVAHIPEDEALLMRNGKFSCTVCNYRPVFDTLDILAVHRKGKKHMAYLTRYLHRKKKDQDMLAKCRTDLPKPTGRNAAKKQKILGDHHALLKAKPYNSCMKRKPAINVGAKNTPLPASGTSDLETTSENQSSSVVKEYLQTLPKKRNFSAVVAESKVGYPKAVTVEETLSKVQNCEAVIDFKQPVFSPENIEMKRECLKLLESGWKKDWRSGKWVKDETVEFDSDDGSPEVSEIS